MKLRKILSVMVLTVIGFSFSLGMANAEYQRIETEVYTISSNTCITNEADAKALGDAYVKSISNTATQMLPTIAYKVNGKYVSDDAGLKDYICDNPEVSVKTNFENCVVDKYYLDAAHTQEINAYGKKIGDLGLQLTYIKDNNGCITGIKYITTLYVTCKSNPTTTTTTTKPVSNTTTKAKVTTKPSVTSTTVPSKDNPETGDNVWVYIVAGVILVAGCGIVLKKVATKE